MELIQRFMRTEIMDEIARLQQMLIRNLVVVDQAGDDDAERKRLNAAAFDGTQIVINDESFIAALVAANRLMDWLLERAARSSEATKSDILRELALWSAQEPDEPEDPSGAE